MSSMNSEIKDKAYHEELVREIEIKEARSLFLLQEIQYLKTVGAGRSRPYFVGSI